MKKLLLIFFIICIFVSCNQPSNTTKSNEKVWVYLEVAYTIKNDTTADFIFGRISKTDLEKFEKKTSKTELFKLTDGRYLNDDNEVRDVQELNEEGTFYYRFNDIVYMEIQNIDPLLFKEEKIAE